MLVDYHDYIVCDYLEFGWPVGYVRDSLPVRHHRNHQGTVLFPEAIDTYLKTECSYGGVLGPFASNPFASDAMLSPLNSVRETSSRDLLLWIWARQQAPP